MKSDVAKTVGWVIFGALMVAAATGHYVFNPFQFGLAYYVGYVLYTSNTVTPDTHSEIFENRLRLVSVIALIFIGFTVKHNVEQRSFQNKVEKACSSQAVSSSESSRMLCEFLSREMESSELVDYADEYYR